MSDYIRSMDRWLKWSAILGPVVGFVLGNCSGAIITYQSIANDRLQLLTLSNRMQTMEGWKDKQEDFNRTTVAAVARLKALVKDMQP